MEANNRFELLASFSIDEKPIETSFIDIKPSEQKQDEQPTRNFWDIPEYVEKSIPCSIPLTTKTETSQTVKKEKTSRHMKKVKPIVDSSEYEEQQQQQHEVEIFPTNEVQNQPTTYSYYPPQPYKFKQTPDKHPNQIIPKFNRKNNTLPKHTSSRGNSKSCTHQI